MKRDPNDSERDYDTESEPNETFDGAEPDTQGSASAEGEGTSQRTRSKSTGRSSAGSGNKRSGSRRGKRSTEHPSHRTPR